MDQEPKRFSEIVSNPEELIGDFSESERSEAVRQRDFQSELADIDAEIAEIRQRMVDGDATSQDMSRLDKLKIDRKAFTEPDGPPETSRQDL